MIGKEGMRMQPKAFSYKKNVKNNFNTSDLFRIE